MKRKNLCLVVLIMFFVFVPKVMADYAIGSLRYNIENVVINNNKITISGYAFIHRTHNYVTVHQRTGAGVEEDTIIKDNGGQRVSIRVKGSSGQVLEKIFDCVNDNYNFYYQMFNHTGSNETDENDDDSDVEGIFNINMYNSEQLNDCDTDKSQCYYEDIGFKISFTIDELLAKFSGEDELRFEIAAYNNHYGKWTSYETLRVINVTGSSKYIDIVNDKFNGSLKIFAKDVAFQKLYENSRYDVNGTRFPGITGNLYRVYDKDDNAYTNGFYKQENVGVGGYHFLDGTYSPGKYAVCVNSGAVDACSSISNNLCNSCSPGNHLVSLYGSWVEADGNNQLIIKVKGNGCDVTTPSNGPLECNESKTFNSKCDKLTVVTSEGNADVTIEQTGHISSVLTPTNTYAGGGISFGIMYYNTIRWDYVSGKQPNNSLHVKVKDIMNNKLKDYNSYIDNINITELKFNNKLASINMIKSCSTNKNSKDYYNDELVTTCVFSFPLADILLDGNVSYKTDSAYFNINNKYYTPLNFNGKYSITAKISGIDRITDSAATGDSKEKGKRWTGLWEDTFTNCDINLYTLISGIPKFIYRPIDINNPFPNRNAGINWYDWWSVNRNKEKLRETYSNSNNIDYTVLLDNKAITDIKNYNSNHNYLEWDSIDRVTKESSFITENSYIVRGGN